MSDVLVLNAENFWSNGVEIEDMTSSDSEFQIGACIVNKCTLSVNNSDGDYDNYDFEGKQLTLDVLLDGTSYQKGVYVIKDVQYTDYTITLECYDLMCQFDKYYGDRTTFLEYPCSVEALVRNLCDNAKVPLAMIDSPLKSNLIATPPLDTATLREVLSWCAQLLGCYAKMNRNGQLVMRWYGGATATVENVINKSIDRYYTSISGVRGVSDKYSEESRAEKIYRLLAEIDSCKNELEAIHIDDDDWEDSNIPEEPSQEEEFEEPETEESSSGSGDETETNTRLRQVASQLQSIRTELKEIYPDISETIDLYIVSDTAKLAEGYEYVEEYNERHGDTIGTAQIDAVSNAELDTLTITSEDDTYDSISKGTEDYMIELSENKLYQSNPRFILDLYSRLYGKTVRKATVQCIADPTIEAGDNAVVRDTKNNSYVTIAVTGVRHTSGRSMTLTSAGVSSAIKTPSATSTSAKNYVTSVNRSNLIESNISRPYSNTETYKKGDYVYYNNNFYVAKENITTAGDFDASKWQKTVISDNFGTKTKGDWWIGSESEYEAIEEYEEDKIYFVYADDEEEE